MVLTKRSKELMHERLSATSLYNNHPQFVMKVINAGNGDSEAEKKKLVELSNLLGKPSRSIIDDTRMGKLEENLIELANS